MTLLRRALCALGFHPLVYTLYADRGAEARDGRGQYAPRRTCLRCGRDLR